MDGHWTEHVSFSQLVQIEQCPYSYYMTRIAKVDVRENAFAQAGSLVHALLAGWARGELSARDLPRLWQEKYDEAVTELFPVYLETKGYRQKLHDAVLEYFAGFDGFPGYDVVAAEQVFVSSLAGERFTGVIDLILRDQTTGDFVLVDHKSSSLSSFRKTKTKMYRQLLLYAKHIADQYGVFPSRLCVNLFKEHTWDEQSYQLADFIEAVAWAEESIQAMHARELPEWLELRPEQFYCTQLCAARDACPYGNPQYHKKDEVKNHRHQQPEPAAA